MAVNIDTVYQKVLMFANKEQRGYITPQEFNLFADQAQLEIFEQYFYDMNFYLLKLGNSKEYSDIRDNLNEKIAVFETTGVIVSGSLPTSVYRLGTVYSGSVEIEELQANETLGTTALTAATTDRPTYVRTGAGSISISPTTITSVACTYIKKPTRPNWSYVVVNGKAMYDNSNVNHFELHAAEESELVYRILAYAGIAMEKPLLTQVAAQALSSQIQQEKQ